jgi:hypothetical protein
MDQWEVRQREYSPEWTNGMSDRENILHNEPMECQTEKILQNGPMGSQTERIFSIMDQWEVRQREYSP